MQRIFISLLLLVISSLSVFSQERNAINLFGKELMFGTSTEDFSNQFKEFNPETDSDTKRYCQIKKNPGDPFMGHSICAEFVDNRLVNLTFHGSSEENVSTVKHVLKQFKYIEMKITVDELGIETEFYKKDDLTAELIEFETTYLII